MSKMLLLALVFMTGAANAQIRRDHRPLPPPRHEDNRYGRGDIDDRDDDFRSAYGSDLQIGRRVYTRYGQEATVRAIFSNGDIMIDISGISQNKKREDLAVEGCRRMMRKRICTGDAAYTAYGQPATVKGFFISNEIIISISGIMQVKQRDDLAVPGCSNNFCTNDSVVTRYGQAGIVRGVFTNGDLMIDISGILQRKTTGDLANTTVQEPSRPGDYDAVRIGQKVWTRYGQPGTVVAIFASGEISVNISGIVQMKNRADLGVEGCASRDLCSGDRVVNRYGQAGTVVAIMQNRTEVLVDISGIIQLKNTSDLARTN